MRRIPSATQKPALQAYRAQPNKLLVPHSPEATLSGVCEGVFITLARGVMLAYLGELWKLEFDDCHIFYTKTFPSQIS